MTENASPTHGDDRQLNVLFVSGFDSANYAYVEMIRELDARGHRRTVLVKSERDTVNTAMFSAAGIPMRAVADYPHRELDSVDFVFAGPHLRGWSKAIIQAIERRDIFVVSLANLFSAVTMNVAPDLVFASSAHKLAEFEQNGLVYRAVAVGNPQYDPLVRARAARLEEDARPVRKVLVVDQGAYPLGETGKRQLADTLVAIARNNPEMSFQVKPRHLPEEHGDQAHSISEHLYDYLTDIPENMTLMRTPAIIEELLLDFDAMITTWSTGHLAAVALGIPLLLIDGLDSVDVYDVRRRRVAEAYEHLRASGCVVDWRGLRTGRLSFSRVSEQYAELEFDDPEIPSAPRIVDALETIDRAVLSRGARFATVFRSDNASFVREADTFETVPAGTEARRHERELHVGVNEVVQKLVFDNRRMGFALDMRRMLPVWDWRPDPGSGEAGVRSTISTARKLGLGLKQEYFEAHPDEVADDIFIQDAYFDWLLATGRHADLYSYTGPLLAPETLEFDRGIAYRRDRRFLRAWHHLSESCDISLRRPMRVLKQNKDVRVLLSQVDTSPLALAILVSLSLHRKDEALATLEVPPHPGTEALAYYKSKALVRLGRADEAASVVREYLRASRSGPHGKVALRLRNAVPGLASRWYAVLLGMRSSR
jgi:hypothetical protein